VLRRLVFAIIGLGLVAVVVIGLAQKQGDNAKPKSATISAQEQQRKLAGAPAQLAALHAQANRLLPGSKTAFVARLKQLKGRPVVVNGWASWCGPCRYEFPFLQRASVDLGKRIAFLGLDSEDNAAEATRFMATFPVSYPSYEDPHDAIAQNLRPSPRGLPYMLFYDKTGRLQFVHQGGYPSQKALETDIERYAVRGDG
jgi:cytochrome c biogenesis protein CcmG/thiol:disulfide interchange protein DsbE